MVANALSIRSIHEGLLIAMGALLAHVARLQPADKEKAILEARATIAKSVATFTVKGTTETGEEHDLSSEVQHQILKLVDLAIEQAWRELTLLPEDKSVH